MNTERKKPEYLGDGVYCWHDGYQVWIGLRPDDRGIALEPAVLAALVIYAQRTGIVEEVKNENSP